MPAVGTGKSVAPQLLPGGKGRRGERTVECGGQLWEHPNEGRTTVKRTILLAALGVLIAAGGPRAQATIAGGPHDFSTGSALRNTDATINGQTCVFCHTPHSGGVTVPLWNRNAPATAYQLYTSSSMDAATPTAAAVQSSVSGACLSCHDGSIGIDVLVNLGGAAHAASVAFTAQGGARATYGTTGAPATSNLMTGGPPFMGDDLRNDHPITIIYETARAATPSEFVTQAISGSRVTVGSTNPLPLYGTATATATVECASCHNPHNNTNGTFLRKANTGSALCLTCHIK